MRDAAHEVLSKVSIVNGAAAGASVPSAGRVEGIEMSSKRIVARAGAELLAGASAASGAARGSSGGGLEAGSASLASRAELDGLAVRG
jgi:hypothetical protein